MKRISALLLILLIAFSCTACKPASQGEQETTAHIHTQPHTTEEITPTTVSEETSFTASVKESEPQPADTKPAESEKTTQAESDTPSQNTVKNLYRGIISEDTYTSPTTDLNFTKPADWKFLSDEELALKIGVDAKELEDYVFPTTADRVPAVYDMWATDPESGVSISVAYENMYVTTSVALTTDEYLEMLEGAFRNTKGTELLGKYTVKLSGQTYRKAIFQTETGGTSTQSIYYLRAMGKFMNIVLVTIPAGAYTPSTEKMFS